MLEIAKLYETHAPQLVMKLQRFLALGHEESEDIVQEVFVGLLSSAREPENTVRWLHAAVGYAGRAYLRQHQNNVPFDDSTSELAATPPIQSSQIAAEEALARLPDGAAEVLRERYLLGLTPVEIAEKRNLTPAYARLLVHRSLRKAREFHQSA